MSGIAIIGSAIASALLGKVFGKIIDANEPAAADKKSFKDALDQSTANAKADGVCKAAASNASNPPYAGLVAGDGGGNAAKPEPVAAAPSLFTIFDSLFSQSPVNKSGGKDAGHSREDLAMMISHTGESDFQRAFMLQSVIDNFPAVDTNKNGKVSNSEINDYERFVSASGAAPLNTAIISPAGAVTPPSAASAINTTTDDSLAKVVAQLMTAYQVDPPQAASSSTISKAV